MSLLCMHPQMVLLIVKDMTPMSTQDLHNSSRGLKFNMKMIKHLRFKNMMPQTIGKVRDVAQEPFFCCF